MKKIPIVLIIFLLTIHSACRKKAVPELKTLEATNISVRSATVSGELVDDGNTSVTELGICWSKSPMPTTDSEKKTIQLNGTGEFNFDLTDLDWSTTYYVRSFAKNKKGIAYGNQVTFSTTFYPIGTPYRGGKIAYFFMPGDRGYVEGEVHGFVVSDVNIWNSCEWQLGVLDLIGASDTSIGKGLANTQRIVDDLGSGNYAAKFCYDYEVNEFRDWYLPSLAEMRKLLLNRNAIGMEYDLYWTSSEASESQSYVGNFVEGKMILLNKNNFCRTRAIHSF